MIGIVVLLITLILVCAIGFIIIYQKLDKNPTQDINLTVNVPQQEVKVNYQSDPQFQEQTKSNEFDWKTNPMEYINKTKTKAHIKWEDTQP
mgnify:CR=1 FL=1